MLCKAELFYTINYKNNKKQIKVFYMNIFVKIDFIIKSMYSNNNCMHI